MHDSRIEANDIVNIYVYTEVKTWKIFPHFSCRYISKTPKKIAHVYIHSFEILDLLCSVGGFITVTLYYKVILISILENFIDDTNIALSKMHFSHNYLYCIWKSSCTVPVNFLFGFEWEHLIENNQILNMSMNMLVEVFYLSKSINNLSALLQIYLAFHFFKLIFKDVRGHSYDTYVTQYYKILTYLPIFVTLFYNKISFDK